MTTRGIATLAVIAAAGLPAAAAHANVQVGTSGWQWGNPQPQGNTLNDMDFGAGGVGYAAGAGGTLLKTTDGGSSWTGLRSGTTTDLLQVQAVAPNTVIAGGGCVARRSDDGGQTFTRIPFTPVESSCDAGLRSFSFIDPKVGFLLLQDGSVFQTTDGGQEFTPRTALPGTKAAGGSASPQAVTFTSATRGVAATTDGRILLTTDAGVSWTLVQQGTPAVWDIKFLSPTLGYAVGNGGLFLRTTDGGTTWAAQTLPVGRDLRSISCASETQCIAATIKGDVLVRIAIAGEAAPVPVPVTPATDTTATTATTSTTTVPTADPPVAPAPAPAPAAPVPGTATAALVSPATDAIYAASFASPTRIAAAGLRGTSVVSDDAGATFTAVGSRLTGSYTGLRAGAQAGTAYALGAGGALATTTSGGRSWTRTNVPTSAALRDVAFPTAAAGFALDTSGGIYRTTSAGQSWRTLDSGTTARAGALTASSRSVLLVGPRGVRRSTDEGETFSAVSGKAVRRATLGGVDRATGTVLAYGPEALLRSGDDGATWKSVSLPRIVRAKKGRTSIDQVDFVSASTGYLLDSRGGVWRTANGGKRWSQLTGVGTTDLRGLSFATATSGFLVTSGFGDTPDSGVVLRTDDAGRTWTPQLVFSQSIGSQGVVAPAGGTSYLLGGTDALMASTTGGTSGAASSLSLSTKSRTLKKHGRITVSGKLSPALGNERVTVSSLAPGSRSWRRQTVRTAANGAFTTSWTVKKGSTAFVAQWAGDQRSRGDGSAVLTVRARR